MTSGRRALGSRTKQAWAGLLPLPFPPPLWQSAPHPPLRPRGAQRCRHAPCARHQSHPACPALEQRGAEEGAFLVSGQERQPEEREQGGLAAATSGARTAGGRQRKPAASAQERRLAWIALSSSCVRCRRSMPSSSCLRQAWRRGAGCALAIPRCFRLEPSCSDRPLATAGALVHAAHPAVCPPCLNAPAVGVPASPPPRHTPQPEL